MNRKEMLERLAKGEDPLELSIEKWQDIVNGKGEEDGVLNCALCETHFGCEGCPVDKFGDGSCEGTPYARFNDTMNERYKLYWARKEVEFLKGLRKEKGT